jgi:uncharacterized peroxidase-related enzyme
MYVQPIPPEEAEGDLRRLYDEEIAEDGFLSNMTLLFSLNPAAYEAWGQLLGSIRDQMDFRRYELATMAAARALRCAYCVSVHGDNMLKSELFDRAQVEAIMRDYRTAGLEPVEVAIMAVAEKVAMHAYKVTPEDIDELRALGMADAEIFNVVLAAAARCFFSKSLDAMGARPDDAFAHTNDLIELLELPSPPTD